MQHNLFTFPTFIFTIQNEAMKFTAQQIAGLIKGKIEGNADVTVSKLSKIEEGEPGSISFLSNPKYTQYIYHTKASVVIVDESLELTSVKLNKKGIAKICSISESASLGNDIYVGDFAVIGENVKIGNNVKIYPQVYIGDNSVIGDNTTLFAGVKVYSETQIGKNCIIHSGTVIGSDGFRFNPESDVKKVPQIGNVIIEDDVELGANCAIDRATLGSTILRKGVKFDNMIHIAHNAEIGEGTYFAAQSLVGGSTKVGKNCMISGQVGMVGHLTIADNTSMTAQAGISKSITKPGDTYMGSPAFEISKYRKTYIHFRNLESLVQRVDKIEKQQQGKS
jgi:UDP-3-O-[3-hydroxymyristoyl] glucosamine N-acyltransferase